MKTITILLTRYSDRISDAVYHLTGHGYTHASIGLAEEGGVYYSFNYKGFCVETLEKHRRRGVEQSMSCKLQVTDEAYQALCCQIESFKARRAELHYTRLGVVCCLLHLPLRWKNHYFCSQFVAEMLQRAGAYPLHKRPELYLPNRFYAELAQSGRLCGLKLNPV